MVDTDGGARVADQTLAVQLQRKRSEMMVSELEDVGLRLFARRGFGQVTVEEIAAEAQISVRTFYRYFPSKEHVLHVRIDRRSAAIAAALAERPHDEPPLRSVRAAVTGAIAAEDPDLLWRWVTVLAATPDAVPGVLGGTQLKIRPEIAAFLADRLGLDPDALVPTVLAAAISGVTLDAFRRWVTGADELVAAVDAGLDVLERLGEACDLSSIDRPRAQGS